LCCLIGAQYQHACFPDEIIALPGCGASLGTRLDHCLESLVWLDILKIMFFFCWIALLFLVSCASSDDCLAPAAPTTPTIQLLFSYPHFFRFLPLSVFHSTVSFARLVLHQPSPSLAVITNVCCFLVVLSSCLLRCSYIAPALDLRVSFPPPQRLLLNGPQSCIR